MEDIWWEKGKMLGMSGTAPTPPLLWVGGKHLAEALILYQRPNKLCEPAYTQPLHSKPFSELTERFSQSPRTHTYTHFSKDLLLANLSHL